jgi:hypothetical protein
MIALERTEMPRYEHGEEEKEKKADGAEETCLYTWGTTNTAPKWKEQQCS